MDLASSPPPVVPKRKRLSTPLAEMDGEHKYPSFSSPEEELQWLRKTNDQLLKTIDALKKTLMKTQT